MYFLLQFFSSISLCPRKLQLSMYVYVYRYAHIHTHIYTYTNIDIPKHTHVDTYTLRAVYIRPHCGYFHLSSISLQVDSIFLHKAKCFHIFLNPPSQGLSFNKSKFYWIIALDLPLSLWHGTALWVKCLIIDFKEVFL